MVTKKSLSALKMAYISLGAVLIALCSWISVPATVPFTLQTFAVLLVCDLLGAIDKHEVQALMHHPTGQSIGYFNEVRTVADVMDSIVGEARSSLERLADENEATTAMTTS